MSKVINYLDCGCAILKDGSRNWCPTCSSPPVTTPSPLALAVAKFLDAWAVCDGPRQPNWREVNQRAQAAARDMAKLAGACWHDEFDNDLEVKYPEKGDYEPETVGVKCKKCGKVLVQA